MFTNILLLVIFQWRHSMSIRVVITPLASTKLLKIFELDGMKMDKPEIGKSIQDVFAKFKKVISRILGKSYLGIFLEVRASHLP